VEKTKSASFDYFGLTLPGNTPEPFAPGLISVKEVKDAALAISPAGDEVIFCQGCLACYKDHAYGTV